MRKALNNAFAQTDVSGTNGVNKFYLRDFAGIDVPVGGTVFVDGSLTTEQGMVGSFLAFQTISTAVALSPPGTTIIVRPGTYVFDSVVQIQRAHIILLGYGAIITADVGNDSAAGFIVSGNFCTIEGFEFNGGVSGGSAVDTDGGVLQVFGATNLTVKNCNIHDYNSHAIWLVDRFGGLMVDNCRISGCNTAVRSAGLNTVIVSGINVKNNTLTGNRNEGVHLTSSVSDAAALTRDIRIVNNEIVSNDTAGASKAGILVDAGLGPGGATILIKGNWIFDHYDGINLTKVNDSHVNGNIIQAQRHNGCTVTGCLVLEFAANTIEGANVSTGNPLTVNGIVISGDYASAYDSGPIHIVGNLFNKITTNPISVAGANDVTVTGNSCKGAPGLLFADMTNLRISANDVSISGTNIAISLVATARGMQGISLRANSLFTTGAPTKLIATNNANNLTFDDIKYIANTSAPGKVYSGGIISHISGAAPTNVSRMANAPVSIVSTAGSLDSRNGWVNDENSVLVTTELDITRGSAREKVIGPRKVGWGVPVGLLARGPMAIFASVVVSNPPTQSEVQNISDNLQIASRVLGALVNDLHADGANSPTHALLDDA